jgi:hypothetical protein
VFGCQGFDLGLAPRVLTPLILTPPILRHRSSPARSIQPPWSVPAVRYFRCANRLSVVVDFPVPDLPVTRITGIRTPLSSPEPVNPEAVAPQYRRSGPITVGPRR